jgi:hypothetical protein
MFVRVHIYIYIYMYIHIYIKPTYIVKNCFIGKKKFTREFVLL